jgi:putative SbcD/Mre11-related phosphoesterase
MHLELIKNEPGLLLREGSRCILVVADLHIGYERTLFKQDQYSSNLTSRIIQHFEKLVSSVKPSEVIILGDLKHSIREFSRQEFHEVAQLLHRIQKQASLTIIRGNHDADLELVVPDDTQIIPSSGLRIPFRSQHVYLLHGHAHPTSEILTCDSLLMGHIHPTLARPTLQGRMSTHRVWVRTQWKPTILDAIESWIGKEAITNEQERIQQLLEMKILILPAFLDLLQGHILNVTKPMEPSGTPIFRYLSMRKAEIFMLDQTPLGKLAQLRQEHPY